MLVALLAMLQCLAPLIHGHILGHDGEAAHKVPARFYAHIHADEFAPELPGTSAMPAFTTSADESPAIGVSQEFKQDHFLLPVLGFLVAVLLLAATWGRGCVLPRKPCPAIRTTLHSRPPATAPPVRAA